MTTFYSSVLHLHATRDGAIQPTQGHQALAAFYDIVEQVDPELAAILHESNVRKPFTLSQLNGLPAMRDGEVRLRAGHECWLRVTLAGDVMFQTFISRFVHGGARPTVRLGAMEFGVSAVLTSPESHPWAGYTATEELVANASVANTIAFEFASPFSFSLGDNRAEMLPRPELIFIGLHRKWQEWSQRPSVMQLSAEWLREYVLVSQWELRSQMLRYGKQLQVGGVGHVMFRLFDADEELLHTLNVLADFAFYAGIGRKTTQGMGQARRIQDLI